jgi:hypothetical protein
MVITILLPLEKVLKLGTDVALPKINYLLDTGLVKTYGLVKVEAKSHHQKG